MDSVAHSNLAKHQLRAICATVFELAMASLPRAFSGFLFCMLGKPVARRLCAITVMSCSWQYSIRSYFKTLRKVIMKQAI